MSVAAKSIVEMGRRTSETRTVFNYPPRGAGDNIDKSVQTGTAQQIVDQTGARGTQQV